MREEMGRHQERSEEKRRRERGREEKGKKAAALKTPQAEKTANTGPGQSATSTETSYLERLHPTRCPDRLAQGTRTGRQHPYY